jgi:bisphosphoglycerate-independent phosphoglycerate mutase (AlkP superfamily)
VVISISAVFVDDIGVVDVTSDIVLGMDETGSLIFVFKFNKEDMVDDIGKEFAVIDDCEAIPVNDSVCNEVELFKDVDIELTSVVYDGIYVLSFAAKIKQK